MTCPSCRRDNQPTRRYCGACGCNFEPACDSCGFANDPADRFCGGCGQSLRAERRARAGAAVTPAAQVERTELTERSYNQDDVDRLFGSAR